MIHSRYVKPRVFSWNSDRAPEQIDRSQDIGGDLTLNREKQYEIGRDGILGYKQNTPKFAYSMTQFEFGSMAFWYALANKENPGSGDEHLIDLDDLKTKYVDITAYLTDDNDTFRGTIWFPKLRTNGFSLNVASPDAIVQRKFDLVGEDYKIIDENYFSYQEQVVESAEEDIVLTPSVPIEYADGKYIFRVLRVRGGEVTEIPEGTGDDTYTFTGPATVTVRACVVADILKVYYPSDTAYTTTWTDNDETKFLTADACEIYMKGATDSRIYRLQSIDIAVTFDRTDYKELGNSEIVQTGVKAKNVVVKLDRYSEDFTLEKMLASNVEYPYIDPREFAENIQLMVKIYTDKSHTEFKMGYLIKGLTPTAITTSQAVEDYNKRTNTLEADNMVISDAVDEIVFE